MKQLFLVLTTVIYLAVAISHSWGFQNEPTDGHQVTPELPERAVSVLHNALTSEKNYVRRHTPELLLTLAYRQSMRLSVDTEFDSALAESEDRIARWQFLALTSMDWIVIALYGME